jgi:hypothetical protein
MEIRCIKDNCKNCQHWSWHLQKNWCNKENMSCDNAKNIKPLAQYLAEYLATGIDRTHKAGMPMDYTEEGLKPILEQALDAYQSTENVMIKIERR